MSNQHKAIENPENVCFNCLKEGEVHKIHIPELGYESVFDGLTSKIHLCPECLKLSNLKWWELEIIEGRYKYEEQIFKFVKQMPVEGQELFFNRYGIGAYITIYMEPQDWIDYELGILSDKKCQEYCLYSSEEMDVFDSLISKTKKQQEFTVWDGDRLQFIADWIANATCDISETLGYDAKKFKVKVSVEEAV